MKKSEWAYSLETLKLISCTYPSLCIKCYMHENVKQVVSHCTHTCTHVGIFEPFICETQQSEQYERLTMTKTKTTSTTAKIMNEEKTNARKSKKTPHHRLPTCTWGHKGEIDVSGHRKKLLCICRDDLPCAHTHYTLHIYARMVCTYTHLHIVIGFSSSRLVSSASLQFVHCSIYFK